MTYRTASKPVCSSQAEPHRRLPRLLETHLARPWQAPLHAPTVAAFEALRLLVPENPGPLILDSGCGSGESTRRIARMWPDCLVIGVDKSAARLRRGGAGALPRREDNLVLVRAELASFWRLCRAAGWRLQRHYLLYPNPWPKPRHLGRRWHAHPVFPDLVRLGGELELRSNWRVYADEFAFALSRLLGAEIRPVELRPGQSLSPFEAKYRQSGHALYAVSASCSAGAV